MSEGLRRNPERLTRELEQVIKIAEDQQKREEQDQRDWDQMSETAKASAIEAQRVADENDAMEAERVVHDHEARKRAGAQLRVVDKMTKAAHWVAWECEQEEQRKAAIIEEEVAKDAQMARDLALEESKGANRWREICREQRTGRNKGGKNTGPKSNKKTEIEHRLGKGKNDRDKSARPETSERTKISELDNKRSNMQGHIAHCRKLTW